MKTTITMEMILNSEPSQISKVYIGKRECCRCGCKGEYYYDNFESRLKRAKKLIKSGAIVDYYDICVDVKTGNNRSMTIYFK